MKTEKRKQMWDTYCSRTDRLSNGLDMRAEIHDEFFLLKDDAVYWDEEATHGRDSKTSVSLKQVTPCTKCDCSWHTFKMLYKANSPDSSSDFLSMEPTSHTPCAILVLISRRVAFDGSLSSMYFIDFLNMKWYTLIQFNCNVWSFHEVLHSRTGHNWSPTWYLADSELPIIYAWNKL